MGRWKDRATGDHGGDLISLYAAIHGIRQIEAARELTGRAGEAAISRSEAQGSNQYGPKKKSRKLGRKCRPPDSGSTTGEIATRIWRESRPAPGTVVETYLRNRGIEIAIRRRCGFTRTLNTSPAIAGRVWSAASKT